MPLVLEILRHGEAEPAGAKGDSARRLSLAGRGTVGALAASLAQEGWRPDRIYSSPMLRALETAEIVRGAMPQAPAIEHLDELLPESEPGAVLEALDARGAAAGHVLLVTHQPLAGRLAGHLAGAMPSFRPGTLVRIDIEARPGAGRGRVVRAIDPAGS